MAARRHSPGLIPKRSMELQQVTDQVIQVLGHGSYATVCAAAITVKTTTIIILSCLDTHLIRL